MPTLNEIYADALRKIASLEARSFQDWEERVEFRARIDKEQQND